MEFFGVVAKGKGFGRELGFPTANIAFDGPEISGIYAARVKVGDQTYDAAVYADTERKMLEAHLIDFSGDLYGKDLWITLHEKVREDARFAEISDLKAQIAADVKRVQELLKALS